jgi:hypothetical protein
MDDKFSSPVIKLYSRSEKIAGAIYVIDLIKDQFCGPSEIDESSQRTEEKERSECDELSIAKGDATDE